MQKGDIKEVQTDEGRLFPLKSAEAVPQISDITGFGK